MIAITPQAGFVKKGQTLQLTVDKNFEGEVKYVSSNKNVATVDEKGLVTAVGISDAYITVFAKSPKGVESSAARIDVPGLMMTPPNPNNETFEVKQGENIVFSILKKYPAIYEVEASVSDKNIAKIKNVGATSYLVSAISEGEVKVTFNLVDTEEEDETLRIVDTVEYTILVGNVESLEFTEKEFECLLSDKEVELPIAISPEDEEYHVKSENTDVFKINEDGKGVPTGLGVAVLKVRRFDLVDTALVRVKGLQVKPIGTLSTNHFTRLDVQCTEKGKPTFKSSNETIATVSDNGIVTGIKAGTVEITVTVGSYSTTVELKCVEFFTPIEDLTTDIKKTIHIFCTLSEVKAFAKGKPVITQPILDGLIPIHYIKTNCDPNLFEYELAILDKDLTRYNSLQTAETPEQDPEPEPQYNCDVTAEIPDNLVVGEPSVIPVTLIAKEAVEKVRVKFTTKGNGNLTYKMTDTLGQEFSFVNQGFWGPEEGFDMPEGYTATTQCTVTADAAGQYTATVSVIKVSDGSVVGTFELIIDAL